jgi:hypothetical protein
LLNFFNFRGYTNVIVPRQLVRSRMKKTCASHQRVGPKHPWAWTRPIAAQAAGKTESSKALGLVASKAGNSLEAPGS